MFSISISCLGSNNEAVRSRRLRGILLATQAVMMGQFASNLGGVKPAKTQTPSGPLENGPEACSKTFRADIGGTL
jgi:hypothetical protein